MCAAAVGAISVAVAVVTVAGVVVVALVVAIASCVVDGRVIFQHTKWHLFEGLWGPER